MFARYRKYIWSLTALLCLCIAAPFAAAHHGWNGYDISLDLRAKVSEVHWQNPHDRLVVVDSLGERWNMLLAPPVRNRQFGFGPGTVEVGETIHLLGERHPNKNEAKIHQIWKDGVLVYEYLYSSRTNSFDKIGKEVPTMEPGTNVTAVNGQNSAQGFEAPKKSGLSLAIMIAILTAIFTGALIAANGWRKTKR